MIDYLPPIQANILVALSRFKFMTRPHLVSYGIGSQTSSGIPSAITALRSRKLITTYCFALDNKRGKLADVHVLTEKGAKIVSENLDIPLEEIRYPNRSSTEFKNDYFHRMSTVSVLIVFRLWTEKNGYSVDIFDTYYDKVGSQRKSENGVQSKTRLDLSDKTSINPDAIIRYKAKKDHFFCIEVHNGTTTKRLIEKLQKLALAINEGAAGEKYGIEQSSRNLIVMEHESYIKNTIEWIKKDPYFEQFDELEEYFFFKSLKDTKDNFADGWVDIKGKKRDLGRL